MQPKDTIWEWFERFVDEADDTFKAALAAGIPIDFASESTDSGIRITGTTRYPCALVGNTLYYRKTDATD